MTENKWLIPFSGCPLYKISTKYMKQFTEYKFCPTYAVATYQKGKHKSNFAQVKIEYTYCQLWMYIHRSSVKIWTHWSLISCSMTTLPHMLSPRSIFHAFVLLHFQACKEKFDAHFKIDIILSIFLKPHKLKCICLWVPVQGNVHLWS
jgi:hypothetical protein